MNDSCPELAATVRRGAFAVADQTETIDYLLTRRRYTRPASEQHGVWHVIAYQRRLHAIKREFFHRGFPTPLGQCLGWWDRS